MPGFNRFKASPFILEKNRSSLQAVMEGKKEYEQAVANMPDKELSRTILNLTQGNNQFACELSFHIQSWGGTPAKENNYVPEPEEEANIVLK